MKKTLFLAVLASAALAGCVKNEEAVKSDSSPERITFEAPVVSVPTRATEIFGNYPNDKDFAVYAIRYEGTFSESTTFDGLTASPATSFWHMKDVTCEANKKGEDVTPDYWAPTSTYYWPKGNYQKLTFGAYAPARINGESGNTGTGKVWDGATVTWGKSGFTFTNFKVQDTPENQIDLLYSDFVKDKTSSDMLNESNKAPYQGLTIKFEHALSSIVFMAKHEPNGNIENITITDLTVNDVAPQGTFVQKPDGLWTVSYDELKNYKVLENGNVPLTATEQPVGGALDGDNEKYHEVNTGDTPETPITPNDTVEDEVTYTNNGKRRSDLILIPQNLKGGAENRGESITADASVTIKYTINYNDGGHEDCSANLKLAVKGNSEDATVYNWEKGKRYIYHITIGLEEIHFNPQVLNWVDEEGKIEI